MEIGGPRGAEDDNSEALGKASTERKGANGKPPSGGVKIKLESEGNVTSTTPPWSNAQQKPSR